MSQKYLRLLALKTITKKKQRTFLSIGAAMISTIIMITSIIMFVFVFSLLTLKHESYDQYHYMYKTDGPISFTSRYHVFEEYQTSQENIYTFKLNGETTPFISYQGKLPESETELLVLEGVAQIGDKYQGYNVVGIYQSQTTNHMYTLCEKGPLNCYYIKDDLIYLSNAYEELVNHYQLDENNLQMNEPLIQLSAIAKNLENGPLILFILILVILLCIAMSFICIENIFVISDQSRKKEFGLLKSVGTSPTGIRYMIIFELLVLGVIGVLLGSISSYYLSQMLISLVASRVYMRFSIYQMKYFILILLGALLGLSVFVLAGYHTYCVYIESSVIADIKDTNFQYDKDPKNSIKENYSFSWNMFLIYNRRMKKQTRNIVTSFALLLVTSILFSSVFLITIVYNNHYTESKYDYILKGDGMTNEVLMDAIDKKKFSVPIDDIVIDRTSYYEMNFDAQCFEKKRLEEHMKQYHVESQYFGRDFLSRVNINFKTLYITTEQLKDFESYLVWGKLEDLGWYEVVAILNEEDYYGYEMCKNLDVIPEVVFHDNKLARIDVKYAYAIEKKDYLNWFYKAYPEENPSLYHIAGIVVLPDNVCNLYKQPFEEYPRIIAIDPSTISNTPHRIYDSVSIRLQNQNDITKLSMEMDELLKEYDTNGCYSVTNIGLEVISNQNIIFILEVLLYPLFGMAFFMALVNIYYVLSGNLYLKQNDISIFKSIGMKSKQLKLIFWFEYIEAYLNACMYTSILFIPISFIQSKLNILEAFDFSGNLMGSLLLALFLLGPLLIVPLVLVHLYQFTKISPLSKLVEMNQ